MKELKNIPPHKFITSMEMNHAYQRELLHSKYFPEFTVRPIFYANLLHIKKLCLQVRVVSQLNPVPSATNDYLKTQNLSLKLVDLEENLLSILVIIVRF